MLGEHEVVLVDCPECGLPAYVEHRFSVRSTEGAVPHAVTLCAQLHRLCMPEHPLPGAQAALPTGPLVVAPSVEEEPSARDAGTS